jgi:hypothetical protein
MAPKKVGYSKKRFPGTAGMRAAAPGTKFSSADASRHRQSPLTKRNDDSPSSPKSMARPGRSPSSVVENARSSVPTSILSGAGHYFGPLSYPGQEYGKRRK